MANIKILANAFVVTSAIKMEDLKNLRKYHPEQLVQKDAETKDEIFKVGVGAAGAGSVSTFGVVFDSQNTEGLAQVTKTFPVGTATENREKYLIDQVGGAMLALNNFENILDAKVAALGTEVAAIKSGITIVE